MYWQIIRCDRVAASIFIAQTESLPGIRSLYERVIDRPWVALIELLLIGTVLYIILRFLQGTRGARLMRAVP